VIFVSIRPSELNFQEVNLGNTQRKSRKLIKLADLNKALLDEAIELSKVVESNESSDTNCEDRRLILH